MTQDTNEVVGSENHVPSFRSMRQFKSKTYHPTMSLVRKDAKLLLVDLSQCSLGRVCSVVSLMLRGADKHDFSYHNRVFNKVVLHNASSLQLTGKKSTQKHLYTHSGFVGGLKKHVYDETSPRSVCFHVWNAVFGMLPKTPSRKFYMRNLHICVEVFSTNHKISALRGISYISLPMQYFYSKEAKQHYFYHF